MPDQSLLDLALTQPLVNISKRILFPLAASCLVGETVFGIHSVENRYFWVGVA